MSRTSFKGNWIYFRLLASLRFLGDWAIGCGGCVWRRFLARVIPRPVHCQCESSHILWHSYDQKRVPAGRTRILPELRQCVCQKHTTHLQPSTEGKYSQNRKKSSVYISLWSQTYTLILQESCNMDCFATTLHSLSCLIGSLMYVLTEATEEVHRCSEREGGGGEKEIRTPGRDPDESSC